MRNEYISALHELAGENRDVLALVGDNGAIVYDGFQADYPEQFLNLGISEANMVSVAAGLAACGKIPFAYTIGCFLTERAFEQVRNDVCMQKMNVKLVGIGAGFVYSGLGPTHHGTEDVALMRALPNMTVLCPADGMEATKATKAAAAMTGPVYLRLATGKSPAVYGEDYEFRVGEAVTLREGCDITIIATGAIVHDVLAVADELEADGVSVRVINMHTLKPIDEQVIMTAAAETSAILTVEEHTISGGLGSCVAEVLAENGPVRVRLKRLGLKDSFAEGYGPYEYVKQSNGLGAGDIAEAARELLRA